MIRRAMYAHSHERRHTAFDVTLAYLRRLLALVAVAALLGALYVAISPVLPDDLLPWTSESAPVLSDPQPLPPRPVSAPALVPGWAWEMHAWHSTPGPERDARPAGAPERLPAWYWEWRAWRTALAP